MENLENKGQNPILQVELVNLLDKNNYYYELNGKIDWDYFEKEFSKKSYKINTTKLPIREIVGCLIIELLDNFEDYELIIQWEMNPYYQYLTGEKYFQHKFPYMPESMFIFRQAIGVKGVQILHKYLKEFLEGMDKEDIENEFGKILENLNLDMDEIDNLNVEPKYKNQLKKVTKSKNKPKKK